MSVLENVLREELERIQSHIKSYERMLLPFPKGYVSIVTVRGARFGYLKWREGDRIKSKYLGRESSPEVAEAKERYLERRRIEKNLKIAKEEQKKLIKALRHYD